MHTAGWREEADIGMNKVTVEINGTTLPITTSESEAYVKQLAKELEEQITIVTAKNSRVSYNEALLLISLNVMDNYKKSEQAADNLRAQLSEYLEDAARARIEADEAKRETERLNRLLEAKGK